MSSPSGRTLESFVQDSLIQPPPEMVAAIVKVLEPKRQAIEDSVSNYDQDGSSWRDYRNQLWETYIEDDLTTRLAVDAILGMGVDNE